MPISTRLRMQPASPSASADLNIIRWRGKPSLLVHQVQSLAVRKIESNIFYVTQAPPNGKTYIISGHHAYSMIGILMHIDGESINTSECRIQVVAITNVGVDMWANSWHRRCSVRRERKILRRLQNVLLARSQNRNEWYAGIHSLKIINLGFYHSLTNRWPSSIN